jgi:hypothetical protein
MMSMHSLLSTSQGVGMRHWKAVTKIPLIVQLAVNVTRMREVYSKRRPTNSFRMKRLRHILAQPKFAMKRMLDIYAV